MKAREQFTWTPPADAMLRRLHADRWTPSGIAQRIGCNRLDVIHRAVRLGLRIDAFPNSKLSAEIHRAMEVAR